MAKVRDIEDQSEMVTGKVNEPGTTRKTQLNFFQIQNVEYLNRK